MKLDLLAIAAHSDDVELTCGGTLLKARRTRLQDGHPGSDRWRDGNTRDSLKRVLRKLAEPPGSCA